MNGKPEEIVSILKEEISQYEQKTQVSETGSVVQVGDGIATVYGLENVMYGELLEFENGVRALAMNLETGSVGCALLGPEEGIEEGDLVRRTGRRADVPAGEEMLGRVIDALGNPIDGKGPIHTTATMPIEREASGVVTRKSVTVPLQTGILAVDAMVPIGRGQRELIIGDRQTGKTSIAIDTILNQKGQDVICIYVAIGQKRSTVANLVQSLTEAGAKEQGIPVKGSKYLMTSNGRTLIAGAGRGYIKLVSHRDTGAVLGAQLLCERATDLVGELTAAVREGKALEEVAAQVRARGFYEKAGYTAYGEEFPEEYCPHIWMKKQARA